MIIKVNEDEYNSMLAACKGERVFSVVRKGSGFEIQEGCDGFFGFDMTREQLLALADELRALANSTE